jgi:hypothetical protein
VSWQNIVLIVLLTLAYGAVIAGLVWLQRRAGVPARWAILLGCLVFGVATGLLAAWAWPYDSCVLPNVWAVLLGDVLYGLSSEILGDPAVLRVPWIYPLVGAILYGALGLAVQAIVNRQQRGRSRPAAGSHNSNVQA